MPYGVGGAAAEGLRSGFEMGRQVQEDERRHQEFDRQQALREESERRLMQLEQDRYGRAADAARMDAIRKQIEDLQGILDKQIAAGKTVTADNPVALEQAQLRAQMADMAQRIASSPQGRIDMAPARGTGLTQRPNVASADTSAVPPADAAAAAPPVAAAPAAPTVDATPPTVTSPAPSPMGTGLGPQAGPVGAAPAMDSGLPINAAPAVGGVSGSVPGGTPAATVASPVSSAKNPAQATLADLDQHAQNTASRLQMGQTDLGNVSDGDFALMMTAATGRPPSEIGGVRQHIADWEAGMQTGNNGLMLQGLNGVFGPRLQAGVGGPSPYGGTITGKQVIGLDPAMSADGRIHPDKVIPRLRVTTDIKGADGTPLYYDAPLTQNRSIAPNDPVSAVSVQGAADHIGNLGTLLTTLDHPEVAAKLERGAKDPRVQQYLDAIVESSQPANPAARNELILARYMHDHPGVSESAAVAHLRALGGLPYPARFSGAEADYDVAQRMVDTGQAKDIDDAMAKVRSLTHGYSKYAPGAPAAAPAAAKGTGLSAPPAATPAAPQTAEQFLAGLPPEDRQSVLTAAHDPSTLAAISTKGNRREHIQNLVTQYAGLLNPGAVDFTTGKGAAGIDKAGNVIGGDSPDTIRFYALRSISGDNTWKTGLARSAGGGNFIKKIESEVPNLASQLGLGPGDIGSNQAQMKALTATLQDRTKYNASVEQLSGTLNRQADLVLSLLAKGGATEGGPLFNAPYNKIREALGSTDAHNLDVALTGLAREHQRVLVSPLSNAQLAVQAQATGDKLANLNLSPSQIRGTIDVMRQEVANARSQAQESESGIRQRIHDLTPTMPAAPAPAAARGTGLGASAPAPAPAQAAAPARPAPPVGTVMKGYRFKGGDPAQPTSWEPVQ